MRAFTVKVKTSDGQKTIEVRATSQAEAAGKALWRFLPGTAEVLWVEPVRMAR